MSLTAWRVVLIGAGELGSRHLQSVATLPGVMIDVVESALASRELARQRLGIASQQVQLRFFDLISQIEPAYDVAIIATGSAVRFHLTQQLLMQTKVRYLLLEKVLFQQLEHYHQMQQLLAGAGVVAYVNCPRRLYPLYQQLRQPLSQQPVTLQVTGNLWGMACNSIHFIDLVAFLTTETLTSVDVAGLTQSYASKRPGYVEVAGRLAMQFSAGSTLQLQSTADEKLPLGLSIELIGAGGHWCIDESQGRIQHKNDPTLLLDGLPLLYQSQLTAAVLTELMTRGDCDLTPYPESAALHLPLIQGLLSYFRQDQPMLEACPIT